MTRIRTNRNRTNRTRMNAMQLAGLLALFLVAGLASAQSVTVTDAALNLSDGSTERGAFLTDGNGFSLYLFLPDHGAATPTCTEGCATNWPPMTVSSADAEVIVGEGVDAALLGTIERADGTLQVTYSGYPLYYFIKDTNAGDVTGQGVGDNWYLVTADGVGVGATMPE